MSPESLHQYKDLEKKKKPPAKEANKARLMRKEENQESVMVFIKCNERLT